jgi:hypothetical protein
VAIRDKMRANAAHLLHDGETIEQVFPAQTSTFWWVGPVGALLVFLLLLFKSMYRAVVVTDQRILVCHAGRFFVTKVKDVITELPRSTSIGPPRGVVWYRCETLGERLYIHKRFHKDIAQADTAWLSGAGTGT